LAYKLASSYKSYTSDEIYYVDSARRLLRDLFHYNVNETAFSGKTDANYYNLEHPPLGKYIIGLAIVACGDRPLCWRVPGIVEATLIILAVSAVGRPSSVKGLLAGAVAAIAASADPILYRSASLAMLDIHLAFFLTLSMLAASYGRFRLAAILAGLATSVKYSGVSALLAILALVAIRPGDSLRYKLRSSAEAILLAFSSFTLVHLPLLAMFTPAQLVEETLRALGWHTTSRPPGPPTSTPMGWVFNVNPFYYTFQPGPVAAVTNTVLHLYGIATTILIALLLASGRNLSERVLAGPLNYVMVFAVYLLVMALGNKTLYSFYAVQLTPGLAGTLASSTLLSLGEVDERSPTSSTRDKQVPEPRTEP